MKKILINTILITVGLGLPNAWAQDSAAEVPENWACDADWYTDETCDCGCGVDDPSCPQGHFDICERSGCPEGQVPWEHAPDSCMRSACGDGWVDEELGEVCDDGEALDSGGCSGDCQMINVGWTCGEMAEGCESSVVKEEDSDDLALPPNGAPDESVDADNGDDTSGEDGSGGCSSVNNANASCLWVVAFLALLGVRRRDLFAR